MNTCELEKFQEKNYNLKLKRASSIWSEFFYTMLHYGKKIIMDGIFGILKLKYRGIIGICAESVSYYNITFYGL